MWDGVKRPDKLSGMHVIGADIARSRAVELAGSRAEDDQVFENAAGSTGLNGVDRLGVAAEALFQIHAAVVAKGVDCDAGARIDFLQIIVDGEYQTPVGSILALPIVEAAIGGSAVGGVRPDGPAGSGIERHDRAVFADNVHDIVDNQRTE